MTEEALSGHGRALSRRALLGSGSVLLAAALSPRRSLAAAAEGEAPAPTLTQLIRHPLLTESLYGLSVSKEFSAEGAAGANQTSYRWIEEQRQGAEWIVRGVARSHPEWVSQGWRQLDWGLAKQTGDGGFGSGDPFHSTSLFVEALARACLVDPTGATPARQAGLARGAAWLYSAAAEARGVPNNAPYTHRRYVLAAALGQAARVTGDDALAHRASAWAREGLALQRPDGTNPEKDGFDVGYQMVGVLMALRYLPVCDELPLRALLRAMARRAVSVELTRLRPDGTLDASDSTRVEREHARSGKVKELPSAEIVQALVFGAQALPEPAWFEPARRIIQARGWSTP
jgi:hypothetical protein